MYSLENFLALRCHQIIVTVVSLFKVLTFRAKLIIYKIPQDAIKYSEVLSIILI